MKITRGSGNIFRDLGFGNEESVHLQARANLMIEIVRIINHQNWTPIEAAKALGVSQPRISELRKGKMEKFSLELLIKYLTRLGKKVSFTIDDSVA
jgi:predicted XRE-type DNA-binding protein